ncbi:PQQ-binding-like beta-propeller repeat protein [Pirellulaceae bacterium SH467]
MTCKSIFRRTLLSTMAVAPLLGGALIANEPADKAKPTDWYQWRGPQQNGQTTEKGLPTTFKSDGETVLWRKEEFASRSTPVVMNGRLYLVCRHKPETPQEAEKTVCVNAETGELIWESIHNIFLSDAPSERIGWSSVYADPDADRVYVLGLGCIFQCLDGATGKVIWEKSLLEEYGMLSTYGGRTNFPVVYEDTVIISGVLTSWGENALPAHRLIAMDKRTGAPIWMMNTRPRPEDTTYSTPVFTVLNGQAAMVFGAADGALYAVQPRTGKVIWKYQVSPRGFSVSPLVVDGIVYCGHGEQNETDRTVLGAVFALDGNTTGEITDDKLLWKIPAKTVSRSCPVKIGDRVYFIEDGAALIGVNAKSGEIEAKAKLGRVMFGSPIVSEGKMFVAENSGIIQVLTPNDKGVDIQRFRLNDQSEVFASFVVSNGKMYLPTSRALYCFGNKDAAPSIDPIPEPKKEEPLTDTTVAHIQVCPVEMLLVPGQKAKLQVRAYNAAGQYLKLLEDAQISVDGAGTVSDGQVYVAPDQVSGGTTVSIVASSGELKSTARARVIGALPWNYDFEDKKVPNHWIGAAYRHQPAELPTGGNGLVKISTIPKGTRSQGFIGLPKMSDYTIEGEFLALDTKNKVPTTKLPDMGLNAQRYTLALEGSQQLKIRTWLSHDTRFSVGVPFEWSANTWYSMKFRAENKDGKAILRGKVWKKGDAEPEGWTIEGTDDMPNTQGSPGIFGNSTDAEFYIDNIKVSAN